MILVLSATPFRFLTSYFPLTKSFNVKTDNASVAFKIKAWQIYLITLTSVFTIIIVGFIEYEGSGSLMGEFLIWSSVALGIHYLVRNAGNKEIMIYGIVAVPLVFGIWYVAFAFGIDLYYIYAIGFTIAVTVNGIYHSVKRIRQKKEKGIT